MRDQKFKDTNIKLVVYLVKSKLLAATRAVGLFFSFFFLFFLSLHKMTIFPCLPCIIQPVVPVQLTVTFSLLKMFWVLI